MKDKKVAKKVIKLQKAFDKAVAVLNDLIGLVSNDAPKKRKKRKQKFKE